jgi:hypothetical protein
MASDQRKEGATSERRYVVELEGRGGIGRAVAYAGGVVAGVAAVTVIALGASRRIRRRRGGRSNAERQELLLLEDAVLDAFLADEVLSVEPLEIGAVAPGVVELSGEVSTREVARAAVEIAQRTPGVGTVLNRLEIEAESGAGGRDVGREWTGLGTGMGSRRQGRRTDPARPDDSRHQRDVALERADRAQFEEEGLHHRPGLAARGYDPEIPAGMRGSELDNQSPYGRHATPPAPEREASAGEGRVGEGLKPGTELRLEGADLPRKPHDGNRDAAG